MVRSKNNNKFARFTDLVRSRRRLVAIALLPAFALTAVVDGFGASAGSFFEQVFGDRMPGHGTYNPRSRSYGRDEAAPAVRVVGIGKESKRPRDFRSGALGVGRAEGARRKPAADRASRSPRPAEPTDVVRVHTPDQEEIAEIVRRVPFGEVGGRGGSYRTVCVRECDGYYFPISFATARRNFRSDAEACASQCGAPASLYFYPNPGADVDDMVSYETGKRYVALETAFRYRKQFDAACRCQPEPWTEEAKARHRSYALANIDPHLQLAQEEAERAKSGKRYASRKSWSRRRGAAAKSAARAVAPVPVVSGAVKRRVAGGWSTDLGPTRVRSVGSIRAIGSVRRWSF